MSITDDSITDDARINSLGEVDDEPQQTDNGPKPGDDEVADQDSVTIPTERDPAPGTAQRSAVLTKALGHKGTVENPVGSNRQPFGAAYGWNGVAWCNIFVSQMGREAAGNYGLLGKFALTTACAHWWDERGRFGREPRPGAVVFFDWSGSNRIDAIDHVGLVICALPNGRVRTIEGNAAISGRPDGVWVHDRNPANIVGYGYPVYAGSSATLGAGVGTHAGVAAGSRILRLNDSGDDVLVLQRALGVEADGEFGPVTRTALIAFQQSHHLLADGEAGPQVWAIVLAGKPAPAPAPGPTPSPIKPSPPKPAPPRVPPFPGTLSLHSTGDAVRALQRQLVARGWRKVVVDGEFGPATRAVIVAFQNEKGLEVDGVVGQQTWAALWTAPITP